MATHPVTVPSHTPVRAPIARIDTLDPRSCACVVDTRVRRAAAARARAVGATYVDYDAIDTIHTSGRGGPEGPR